MGTVFGLGTIITGMFWAKPTWNTYWTWDPRLTTSTITVLIYIAYLLFRNGIDDRRTRALFGSIYAILAFLSVPLTYYSARRFRSIHPVVFGNENPEGQGGFSIGPSMGQTLSISMIGFSVLFSALMVLRWRQLRMEDELSRTARGSGVRCSISFMGFAAVWLLVTVYLVYMGLRQRRIEEEMAALEGRDRTGGKDTRRVGAVTAPARFSLRHAAYAETPGAAFS